MRTGGNEKAAIGRYSCRQSTKSAFYALYVDWWQSGPTVQWMGRWAWKSGQKWSNGPMDGTLGRPPMDIGPGEIPEAEGRQKGEPRSGVGESFHPAPGGCRGATGGLEGAMHHKKDHRNLRSFLWCWEESNCRHMDFQSIALPSELQHRGLGLQR